MILAELQVFHSRGYSPTRRVALGSSDLPMDPPPGFGGILLGGIVAAHMDGLDPDLFDDLNRLTTQLEHGQRITQPRLRHRLQTDRIGLATSSHRLVGRGEEVTFEFETNGSSAQQILAAVYAAGAASPTIRTAVMEAVRKGMRWWGPIGPALVAHLSGRAGSQAWTVDALRNPVEWALSVLGFAPERHEPSDRPGKGEVRRRFRDQLRHAHPDHGGDVDGAAQRIADLTEARRILLR